MTTSAPTDDKPSDQPNSAQDPWLLYRVAREFAEKALSTPYQESTITTRNMLLASSAGLGLWLGGIPLEMGPIDKIRWHLEPGLFSLLATLVQLYLLLAYRLAADTDLEVRRQRVLEPFERVRAELLKIKSEVGAAGERSGERAAAREPLLREADEVFKKREAVYAKILRDLEKKLNADPSDLEGDELWLKVHRLQVENSEARVEKASAIWASDNEIKEAFQIVRKVNLAASVIDTSQNLAVRQQNGSQFERFGAMALGIAVLLWSLWPTGVFLWSSLLRLWGALGLR